MKTITTILSVLLAGLVIADACDSCGRISYLGTFTCAWDCTQVTYEYPGKPWCVGPDQTMTACGYTSYTTSTIKSTVMRGTCDEGDCININVTGQAWIVYDNCFDDWIGGCP